jgi:hypothetical protein
VVVLIVRADGQDVGHARGHEAAAAELPVVPHGRHHDRAAVKRPVDSLLQQGAVTDEAAAEVDHAPAPLGGGVEPGQDLGERAVTEVPLLQDGLRIDAHQPNAVRRRSHHRAHSGSVDVVVRDDCLGVQEKCVRAVAELRVTHVEARVDHSDGNPGRRRLTEVVADVMDPPLVRNQGVAGAQVRERDDAAVGLGAL